MTSSIGHTLLSDWRSRNDFLIGSNMKEQKGNWGLIVIGCAIALMGLLAACQTEPVSESVDNVSVALTEDTTSSDELPLHLKTQQLLLTSDGAVPKKLDIYPVAAVYNREAVIPPMCYTRTENSNNPCYVCHQDARDGRENVMNDGELQESYSFSDLGLTNHWQNLFVDRTDKASAISDQAILAWIGQDNYSELPERLVKEQFKGWKPDLQNLQLGAEAFDQYGFAKDGSHWVAFNYKPFPSTFWPTNGSTDDVMIRLPEVYRQDEQGQYSLDIYRANLAIVEAQIKGFDRISSLPIDEKMIGKDLNGDQELSTVEQITNVRAYVGKAKDHYIDTYLYPEGTEFLHTVRYVGVSDGGDIGVSTRMKEVRYMKKWRSYPKGTLARYYQEENFDKEAGNLPGFTLLGDWGLDNDMGWSVQGFIENKQGRLRVATHEENLYCMGCHSSIGSTIDKTFSFARKLDGAAGWGYINLKGMRDAPNLSEPKTTGQPVKGEIATYFERAGGGDEFRSNPEMLERWFTPDGQVNHQALKGKDVYELITPSPERALALNKAYKVIVQEQSFYLGRDATLTAPVNVYKDVDNETTPTLDPEHIHAWDIRLNWAASQ